MAAICKRRAVALSLPGAASVDSGRPHITRVVMKVVGSGGPGTYLPHSSCTYPRQDQISQRTESMDVQRRWKEARKAI